MSVPFALGRIIDLIYSLDQLKAEDGATIRARLEQVCLGLAGIFLIGGLCNFGRVYLMRASISAAGAARSIPGQVSGQNIAAALRTKVFSSGYIQFNIAICTSYILCITMLIILPYSNEARDGLLRPD
jgi:hypothetical protein